MSMVMPMHVMRNLVRLASAKNLFPTNNFTYFNQTALNVQLLLRYPSVLKVSAVQPGGTLFGLGSSFLRNYRAHR